jgi:hypothetical protein
MTLPRPEAPLSFDPQRRGKVVLQGDLSAIHVPDLLTFLSMLRKSGELVLRQEPKERRIFWKEGDVSFATSNSPEHSLGQFLLRNGKISEEQWRESINRVTPEMRHGKVLVQMGAISPKELWWGVKHQVLDIIYSLFPWQTGEFVFHETAEELHERITLSIGTSSLIMEGIRRMDEGARIREKITGLEMIFAQVPGAEPQLDELDLSEEELKVFDHVDGNRNIRELIGLSDLTEFEVTRILFQLLSARLIQLAQAEEKRLRPVFLDVEDSPELLRVISTYNDMFGRLYATLASAVGEVPAREIFVAAINSDSNELWEGVFFDQYGRFDENMLLANISELPFEERKPVLDEGLNTLLSIQLFEVSQHLNPSAKVELFRFISDQKALIERQED